MTDSREISLPRIIEMVASARRFFFDEKMKNDVLCLKKTLRVNERTR